MPYLEPDNKFDIEQPLLVIHFAEAPLKHFERNRQTSFWKAEAGGQLFAELRGSHWTIVQATGPRQNDYRRRFRFFSSRKDEQSEIDRLFSRGLHYVGDWHSHPERHPYPSPLDFESMRDLTRRSIHQLPGFLMVIVGTEISARGLWISLHSSSGGYQQISLH